MASRGYTDLDNSAGGDKRRSAELELGSMSAVAVGRGNGYCMAVRARAASGPGAPVFDGLPWCRRPMRYGAIDTSTLSNLAHHDWAVDREDFDAAPARDRRAPSTRPELLPGHAGSRRPAGA